MRTQLLILLLVSVAFCGGVFADSRDCLEINLIDREVKFIDFCLGGLKLNGKLFFAVDTEDGSLTLEIEGRDITLTGQEDKSIPWFRAKLILGDSAIVIPYLCLPGFTAEGTADLGKGELRLNIEGSWIEKSKLIEGEVEVKAKVWGGFDSFLASGYFVVDGGKYKGREFSRLRLDFLGRPPMLNITDSQIVFQDGNVIEIKGELDLRDFSNILPRAEFKAKKVFIDQWQLFSGDDESIGLKRNLDEKFGVFLDTNGESEYSGPRTELRYNWKDDKFLRLKMDAEATTLRFEKRKDF